MNIVYVSRLSKNKWAGPNTSVPKQIQAQSKVDNVFWYNVNNIIKGAKVGNIKCHCVDEYPTLKITDLPIPYNNPDLVIFEGLYFIPYLRIASNCRRNNIPYIIIPRSSLTAAGQKSKALKKKIGNTLFFNRFIRNAIGIQYLTKQEYLDSGDIWNQNNIIIPNGIDEKTINKTIFNTNKLNGIFIGRLDIYQKGLDILIEACGIIKEELKANNCIINIHGPSIRDSKAKLEILIKNHQLEDVIFIKDAVFDKEKEKILLESDFFILTSRFEGHPMGLIEALSYGLPCLVTTGTNMAKEIAEVDAGWTADTNIDSIKSSLVNLIEEKNLLQSKGLNAINLSKRYNWDRLAIISHKSYINLLKQRIIGVNQ